MAGYIMRSDFPLFMTPRGERLLKRMWEPTENLLEEMRNEYYRVSSTDNAYDTMYGTVGIGRAVRKPETTPKRFDAPQMGRPFTLVYPTYALAIGISREAQEDDQTDTLVPMITRELKRSMIETMEEDAAAQFNDGFDYQGWESDGVALFSTAHPYMRNQDGSSIVQYGSNRHPTDAALSISALDAAFTAGRTLRNDTGRWLSSMDFKYLDVAPALVPYALQLIGTQKVLGSNNNDKNLYYNQLTVRSNPRFEFSGMWVLSAGKERNGWIWKNRRSPDLHTEIDYISDVTVVSTSARWGRGATDWRGVYGSRGA